MGKEQHPQSPLTPGSNRERRRSASKDRVRRDSLDSVAYDKGGQGGQGDEVSIGMEWSGDGVSTSTYVEAHSNFSHTVFQK